MSGIFSGTAIAGLLAAVAMVAAGHDGTAPESTLQKPMFAGQAYKLQIGGDSESCVVEKGKADATGDAALKFNGGCADRYPRVAGARFWSERPDGSVAFTRSDGKTVIEFAVADGVAYQSFEPGAPLASLIALN